MVSQSPVVHNEIRSFLDRLRRARGLPLGATGSGEADSLTIRRKRPGDRLTRPVTFTFVEPTEFATIVRHWCELSGLTILVDWSSTQGVNIAPDSKIACSAIQAPFGEALTSVLEPLGMTWRVVDGGTLELIEVGEASRRLEVEFHAADHWGAGANGTVAEAIGKLQKATGAALWSEQGGTGVMAWDAPGKSLIVRQTQAIQTRIDELLSSDR
jgi:hypothetical protein